LDNLKQKKKIVENINLFNQTLEQTDWSSF